MFCKIILENIKQVSEMETLYRVLWNLGKDAVGFRRKQNIFQTGTQIEHKLHSFLSNCVV